MRVNGRARLTAAPNVLTSFAIEGKSPRTVMVIEIVKVYFRCSREILRSDILSPSTYRDPSHFPTAGDLLTERLNGVAPITTPRGRRWRGAPCGERHPMGMIRARNLLTCDHHRFRKSKEMALIQDRRIHVL